NNSSGHVFGWLSTPAEDMEVFIFHVGAVEDQLSLVYRLIAGPNYYHLPGDIPSTARFIKSLGLDVLVFPDAGSEGMNMQYASMRLAPIQCATLGCPYTSGLSTIDYYLSSDEVEPTD